MAKITISDIAAAFASVPGINSRFQQIEDYINDKVLSRDDDGETNTMLNDLDMNSNDVLNGGTLYCSGLVIGGVGATASELVETPPAGSITVTDAGGVYTATDVETALQEVKLQSDAAVADVADLRTTQGTSDGDTDMGAYTGSTVNDSGSVKVNIQDIETAYEAYVAANNATVAALNTLSGVAADAEDMGTYTGSTLTDNETIKENVQELEEAIEKRKSAFLEFQGTHADIADATLTPITWQSGDDVYDTASFFNVSNPTRLTVPTGATYAKLTAMYGFDSNGTGIRTATISHRDSFAVVQGQYSGAMPSSGTVALFDSFSTGWIPVTAGEYFQLEVFQNSGGLLGIIDGTTTQKPSLWIETKTSID